MACGCKGAKVPLFTWTGPSGQKVTGLTKVQAQARVNHKGGTIAPQ